MSETTAPTPSQSDINFMIHIFQHMTEKPVIDWNSFAEAAGFKNATVAQTRWGQIKRKFNVSGGQTTPKKATPKKSVSKVTKATGRVGAKSNKGKVKSEEGVVAEGQEEEELDSPTKQARFKLEDSYI
ncbi:hypothetical protein LX32DRAFT_690984 [Colletotrichum zoysiae]|uniref:Myb-like DNA-binding domain-containing protein n=1 Tax=Colletotrichum zoysiae TaxID=1216348 RepID=A0AAD9M870_9PEZI|nr:hypothetical protein LX32DRAFT_690984 [Colletotrichum zoysiae]